MSKRFTDTEKWKHMWFRTLPPKFKCAWQYVLDNCDYAGVWVADFGSMSFHIGEEITKDEFDAVFKEKIPMIESDKYFAKGFPVFQYASKEGKLNEKNKVHVSAIEMLKKFGIDLSNLLAPAQGLPSPDHGAKDKDNDKDKKEEEGTDKNTPGQKIHNIKKETAIEMATRLFDEVLDHGSHGLKDYLKNLPATDAKVFEKFQASKILNCTDYTVKDVRESLKEACRKAVNSS